MVITITRKLNITATCGFKHFVTRSGIIPEVRPEDCQQAGMVKSKDIFKKVSHAILVGVLKCINTRLKGSLFSKKWRSASIFLCRGRGKINRRSNRKGQHQYFLAGEGRGQSIFCRGSKIY